MTKNEAYKTLRCLHCVYRDSETGICLCGELESDECLKDGEEDD